MAYSDIARSSVSLLTQSQKNSQDGASVNTTIASNVSRQETNDSGMNMITGLYLMKKRMEEIDNQREAFTTKQQRMYEIISTVTSSVSKLSADILAVQIDMNIMSDKLEKKFNEIIAILATTQTPAMLSSPTRKVAWGTNTSPVKHAASNKGPVEAFGGDKEGNSGQVQIYKVPPEALAMFLGQPETMLNNQEKYTMQEQTNKQKIRIGRLPCGTIM
jgi:hypothetical protein